MRNHSYLGWLQRQICTTPSSTCWLPLLKIFNFDPHPSPLTAAHYLFGGCNWVTHHPGVPQDWNGFNSRPFLLMGLGLEELLIGLWDFCRLSTPRCRALFDFNAFAFFRQPFWWKMTRRFSSKWEFAAPQWKIHLFVAKITCHLPSKSDLAGARLKVGLWNDLAESDASVAVRIWICRCLV